MDEKRIKELFQQAGETLQAVLEYFRLKDNVLWEGALNVNSSITVPDLSKYRSFEVYAWTSIEPCICYWNPGKTLIQGGYVPANVTSASVHTTVQVLLSVSENTITLKKTHTLHHTPSGSHGSFTQNTIRKIVGKDPIIPAALQNIIGGGTA